MPDVIGLVLPYKVDDDDLMGLLRPWALSLVDGTKQEHTATTLTLASTNIVTTGVLMNVDKGTHTHIVTPPF